MTFRHRCWRHRTEAYRTAGAGSRSRSDRTGGRAGQIFHTNRSSCALPPIDLSAARKVMVSLPKLQDPDPQVRRDAAAALEHWDQYETGGPFIAWNRKRPNTSYATAWCGPWRRSRCLLNWSHEDSPRRCRIRNGPYAMLPLAPFVWRVLNPESLAALRPLVHDPNEMVTRLAQSAVAAADHPIPVSVHIFSLDQGSDRTLPCCN